MARDITTAFQNQITARELMPVRLFRFFFDSATLRFFTGTGELTYNGDLYTGSANLLSVSNIEETQNLEARGAEFVLSSVNNAIIAVALLENYQERRVESEFGTADANGNIIASVLDFRGRADVMTLREGPETSTITLTAENELIALQRASERRRTVEDQKQNFPDDTFFDFVTSLQSKEIVWGRNA